MEYYNDIFCITIDEWLEAGLSYDLYKTDKRRNYLKVVRGGGNGRKVLIELDSIVKIDRKNAIIAKHGDPRVKKANNTIREAYLHDAKALEYYSSIQLMDGRSLPEKSIKEYTINASMLNALISITKEGRRARKNIGIGDERNFFKHAVQRLAEIKEEYSHTLPANERHLQRVYQKYEKEGYYSLISGKFCNDNRRKVTQDIEHLIMSLYTMDEKPFASSVHGDYNLFVTGKIDVVDKRTGELFDRNLFIKNGSPIELSDSTIWSYLNNPKNRAIVDKARSGQFQYNSIHRPHHHRHSPFYSFSKISMDDRDLPRKLTEGKLLKAYYAYDVASGCVIGYSYSRSKDEKLFIDCLRSTFQLIERNNFGMPMEVEVEHHLVDKFFDDLALMFPYMRICNAGNSQEKRAEHFNKAKKYGVEKKLQKQIGRWWAKGEAYRVDVGKVNDEYVEKTFSIERLIADDIDAIKQYNNQLHPRQKMYPGQTRWQVLQSEMNPNVANVNKAVLYKTIGDKTETTIRRNQYLTVQYAKYSLPNPQIIEKLLPNNYSVDAYYIADDNGSINNVYLYQNGNYICKCDKIIEYNESQAERTQVDIDSYNEQAIYVAKFDKMTKEGRKNLTKTEIIKPEVMSLLEAKAQKVVIVENKFAKQDDDIETLLRDYNSEEFREKALKSI